MSVSMCVCRRGSAGVLKIKKASHQRNELCFDSPLHIFARGGCHDRDVQVRFSSLRFASEKEDCAKRDLLRRHAGGCLSSSPAASDYPPNRLIQQSGHISTD